MANQWTPPEKDLVKDGSWEPPAKDLEQPKAEWTDTEYGFKVRPSVTPDTKKPTVQREDGSLWYGPEQGNTGKPGWFNAKGMRTGEAPGQEPGWYERQLNQATRNIQNPFKELVSTAPVSPVSPGAILALTRRMTGNPEEYAIEKGLPNPTVVRTVKGVANIPIGAAQSLTHMAGSNAMDNVVNSYENWFDRNAQKSASGEALGAALPFMFTGGAASGVLGGSVLGALTSPEKDVQSGRDFWERKGKEAAIGVVTGGAIKSLGAAQAKLGSKVKTLQDAVEAIRNATKSKQFPAGAEPTIGEATGNPLVKAAENMTEYIPGSGKKKVLGDANQALQARLDELGNMTGKGTPEALAQAGEEITESAARQFRAKQAEYGKPIQAIKEAVDSIPGLVKPKNTILALENEIAKAKTSAGNKAVVSELEGLLDEFKSGEFGNTLEKILLEKRRFQGKAETLRKAPTTEQQGLKEHYDSIAAAAKQDALDAAGKLRYEGKPLSDHLKQAWADYAKNVHELNPRRPMSVGQEANIRSARILHGQEGHEGKAIEGLFRGDNPDMYRYAKRALDQDGQDMAKAVFFDRVKQASTVSTAGNEVGFNGLKAAKAIDEHSNFIKEFFTKDEQAQIEGYKNALKLFERAAKYGESVGTGKYAAQIAFPKSVLSGAASTVAGTVGGPQALASALVTIPIANLFTKLTATPGGKALLFKMAKMGNISPTSPAATKMVQEAYRLVNQDNQIPQESAQ